jgi:hypothetical protein
MRTAELLAGVMDGRLLAGCSSGLRVAEVCVDPTRAAGWATVGDVTVFTVELQRDGTPDHVEWLEEFAVSNRIDVVFERYSIGHRGGLDAARRLGVPFVLEMTAPLTRESSTYRAEQITVGDCVVEDELLASADLLITASTEMMLWASRRRTGPTITVSDVGVGSGCRHLALEQLCDLRAAVGLGGHRSTQIRTSIR